MCVSFPICVFRSYRKGSFCKLKAKENQLQQMSTTSLYNRCAKCAKRSLLITDCKCGGFYCLSCLPYDVHNCVYDWKEAAKLHLSDSLQRTECLKVEKL